MQKLEMLSNVSQINAKHGIFQYCIHDQYIGNAINEYGEFSEIELSIMNKFIKKGDIVFDIGCNIGAFSIPFAKKVGEDGKVYTFEPQPFIFNLLKRNINLNNLKNVNLFQNGLGKKKKTIKIDEMDYSSSGNFGGFTLSSKYSNSHCGKVKNQKKISVDISTLDDFLYLQKCDFIKIDVELMEEDVLRGGEKFITKYKPFLWLENHHSYPNSLHKYLAELNYSCFWAATSLYNPDNYFINDKDIFPNISTINTLAIPRDKNINFNHDFYGLTKVTDPSTKPEKVVVKPLI